MKNKLKTMAVIVAASFEGKRSIKIGTIMNPPPAPIKDP